MLSLSDHADRVLTDACTPMLWLIWGRTSGLPELHLIYGDMGASDAFTLCSTCTGHSKVCDANTCATANQTAGLIAEITGKTAEGLKAKHIVHVGDFAYNLQDDGGLVGDQFMVNIEQVAANIPYMVRSPGGPPMISVGEKRDTG